MRNEELRKECDKVVEEWKQVGGFLNCYFPGPIFIEDETVYFDWLKENQLEDSETNQKEYCRLALKECEVYSEEEIEELLAGEWN